MDEMSDSPDNYNFMPFSEADIGAEDSGDYRIDYTDPMPVNDYLPDEHSEAAVEVSDIAIGAPEVEAALEPVRSSEPLFVTERPIGPNAAKEVDSRITQLLGPLADVALPEGVDWQITEFDDLRRPQIKPGLIINGVQMIRYYDEVEQEAVAAISPLSRSAAATRKYGSSEIALSAEPSIAKDRISNHLRPKTARTEFIGSLLNGQAILLPLDTDRVPILRNHEAKSTSWTGKPREREGINVLYTGLLRSSRGRVGQLVVEASYLVRHNVYVRGSNPGHGYLLRGLKVSPTMANMEATLDKQHRDSAQNAAFIAHLAIRYAYGSGFGMKR